MTPCRSCLCRVQSSRTRKYILLSYGEYTQFSCRRVAALNIQKFLITLYDQNFKFVMGTEKTVMETEKFDKSMDNHKPMRIFIILAAVISFVGVMIASFAGVGMDFS